MSNPKRINIEYPHVAQLGDDIIVVDGDTTKIYVWNHWNDSLNMIGNIEKSRGDLTAANVKITSRWFPQCIGKLYSEVLTVNGPPFYTGNIFCLNK